MTQSKKGGKKRKRKHREKFITIFILCGGGEGEESEEIKVVESVGLCDAASRIKEEAKGDVKTKMNQNLKRELNFFILKKLKFLKIGRREKMGLKTINVI